jgi:hypothetical protein
VIGAFNEHRRVFIEVTKTSHQHGGAGWEFGTCLWSPERADGGADIYSLMREVAADDLVFHILEDRRNDGPREHRLCGHSFAAGPYERRLDEPPSSGEWGGRNAYYRVPLRDYEAFDPAVSVITLLELFAPEIQADKADNPRYYPFNPYGAGWRLRQGGYLNACTPSLFDVFRRALDLEPVPRIAIAEPHVEVDREYREARRMQGEREAFARNPALIREAKATRGHRCEACDFDYRDTYGVDYIECHHLNPLAESPGTSVTTTIADVRVLCPNCHRMVHRTRPPMGVEDLRAQLGLAPREPSD